MQPSSPPTATARHPRTPEHPSAASPTSGTATPTHALWPASPPAPPPPPRPPAPTPSPPPLARVLRNRLDMPELCQHGGRRLRAPPRQSRVPVRRVAHERQVIGNRYRRNAELADHGGLVEHHA